MSAKSRNFDHTFLIYQTNSLPHSYFALIIVSILQPIDYSYISQSVMTMVNFQVPHELSEQLKAYLISGKIYGFLITARTTWYLAFSSFVEFAN